jgi:PAS domain S-box-containing protein
MTAEPARETVAPALDQPSRRERRGRPAAAMILALGVAGGLIVVQEVPRALQWTRIQLVAAIALTAGTMVAELFPLHLRHRTETETFSLTDALWTAALILAPASTVLLAVACGVLLAQVARRLPPRKVAFNVGQFVLAMWAATALFDALPHSGALHAATWGAAAGAMALRFVVNEGLVAGVISVVEGEPLKAIVMDSLALDVLHSVGNVAVGIIGAVMWELAPVGVVVAAVPMLLSYFAYSGWLRSLRERDRMQDLYRAGQVLLERLETEGDFRPFLELVARMLDATAAEIVILRNGIAQIFDASGMVSAAPRRVQSVDAAPDVYHRPSVLPCHSASIGGPKEDLGSLAVFRRTPLTSTERSLLEALAAQVYVKLRHSEVFARAIEGEEELARIISSSSDGIFVVGEDARITSWSPAMERITAVPAESAVGKPVWSVLTVPPGEEEVWTRFGNPAYLGVDGIETSSLTRQDGTVGWVRFSRSVLRSAERQPVGVVVVARDVSLDVQAEQAKTNFIAAISHELRTPLTPLKGYLSMLASGQMDAGADGARESFDVMLRHAGRLERLINDLLDASQMEMGQPTIRAERVDLVRLVADVVAESDRDPKLTVLFEPHCASAVAHADPLRTRQVLANLISNAVKHSPPGAPIRVQAAIEGQMCVVSVSDQGDGIPVSEQERIFDRFYRVDDSTTRTTGGIGLGLYITKQLVESMSGRLWVASKAGQGSTFSFSVPLIGSRRPALRAVSGS